MIHTTPIRRISNTVIGIALLIVMLFPVYWMINLSFQASGSNLASSFFPTEFHLDGYRAALADQTGNLVTSMIVSVGSVLLILAIALPAAYALCGSS